VFGAGVAPRLAALTTDVGADGGLAALACTNCGSPRVAAYCAACGEKQPSAQDYSLRGMLLDAFHELTSLDGRLVRSVVALVSRPGLLTREWFEGRRGRYVKPFSLFIMLNVAFFVIQPHTGLLSYQYAQYVRNSPARRALAERRLGGANGASAASAASVARFNATLQDQKKTLLAFCIPVMALAMAVLYLGQGRLFAEHLVFAVHTYAFLLLFMGVAIPLLDMAIHAATVAGVGGFVWLSGDQGITVILAAVLGPYVYLSLRRVYGDGRLAAAVRAVIVFFLIGQLINVYHDVLFYTTLYSL